MDVHLDLLLQLIQVCLLFPTFLLRLLLFLAPTRTFLGILSTFLPGSYSPFFRLVFSFVLALFSSLLCLCLVILVITLRFIFFFDFFFFLLPPELFLAFFPLFFLVATVPSSDLFSPSSSPFSVAFFVFASSYLSSPSVLFSSPSVYFGLSLLSDILPTFL